jgi:hypothetical protein
MEGINFTILVVIGTDYAITAMTNLANQNTVSNKYFVLIGQYRSMSTKKLYSKVL